MDSSWIPQFTRFAALYGGIYVYRKQSSSKRGALALSLALFLVSIPILNLARMWLSIVTEHVPEPYLDEVFHIPQAQTYCEGRYLKWDDKITTPPGLYVMTLVMNAISLFPCSVYHLRLSNAEMTAYIGAAAIVCRTRIEQLGANGGSLSVPSLHAVITGLNIAFFPVIFFFSGLYYTDIASTLVVLLAYMNHLKRVSRVAPSWGDELSTFVIGIFALFMRQTNIFWVVFYMAGLEIVHAIRTLKPTPVAAPTFITLSDQVRFYLWRYSLGDVHDPLLDSASPIDAVLCIISHIVAAVSNLGIIIKRCAWAQRFVLVSFVGFVAWNGGVVLGDKSNHVATIHLAQMLYIWPLFAFFSAPLFIPQFVKLILRLFEIHARLSPNPADCTPPSKQQQQRTSTLQVVSYLGRSTTLQITITLSLAGIAAALVAWLNTIVHPFTLADNRHYMFYVFRYTIRRVWWARFALVPAYVVCGWLCFRVLQGFSIPRTISQQVPSSGNKDSSWKQSAATTKEGGEDSSASPHTSTVLLLVLATTLSLVTAPLVEPRYFILPWVFWRLLVPAPGIPARASSPLFHVLAAVPVIETLWFVMINAITMYIFITRPFFWRGEDGSMADGGRVQRFMW